jgi:hypothetical protein
MARQTSINHRHSIDWIFVKGGNSIAAAWNAWTIPPITIP